MFRTVGDQPSLFESVLPEQLLRLPEELARVDALLDDPAFFAPFVPFFDPRIGRPSTPMETYLRMMFLKFRYRLGYESAVPGGERLDHLAAVLPDPAGGVGAAPDHVDEADHALRSGCRGRTERGAVGQGGRGEAVAHQPGPGGHDGGAGQRVLPDRLGSAGQGDRSDRGHAAADPGRRWGDAHQGAGPVPSRWEAGAFDRRQAADPQRGWRRTRRRPRSDGSPASWPTWPQTVAKDADRVLANAKQALRRARAKAKDCPANGERDAAAGRRRGRLARAVNDLTELLERPARSLRRPGSGWPGPHPTGATRRVSLHDPDARPIAKGRLGKPVEFGHKAQVVDNEDGVVLDYTVEQGNPADAPQLAPAVERIARRTGRDAPRRHRRPRLRRAEGRRQPPRAGGAHRGDPPQRQTGARPDRPRNTDGAFRRTVKWRTGMRRQDQHPQTRLRMGPNPHRRHRRSQDLDRPRSPGPQPDQDQRPRRLTGGHGTSLRVQESQAFFAHQSWLSRRLLFRSKRRILEPSSARGHGCGRGRVLRGLPRQRFDHRHLALAGAVPGECRDSRGGDVSAGQSQGVADFQEDRGSGAGRRAAAGESAQTFEPVTAPRHWIAFGRERLLVDVSGPCRRLCHQRRGRHQGADRRAVAGVRCSPWVR